MPNLGTDGENEFGQAPSKVPSDDAVELAVLAYIVAERPEGVIIPMLALRIGPDFEQGLDGSAVERAIRELVRDGRLQIRGGKVIPHRTA